MSANSRRPSATAAWFLASSPGGTTFSSPCAPVRASTTENAGRPRRHRGDEPLEACAQTKGKERRGIAVQGQVPIVILELLVGDHAGLRGEREGFVKLVVGGETHPDFAVVEIGIAERGARGDRSRIFGDVEAASLHGGAEGKLERVGGFVAETGARKAEGELPPGREAPFHADHRQHRVVGKRIRAESKRPRQLPALQEGRDKYRGNVECVGAAAAEVSVEAGSNRGDQQPLRAGAIRAAE
jgi:hypothetical protein